MVDGESKLERLSGCRIIAGYDPIAEAEASGCWFDESAGSKAADFFPSCLTHIEGSTAGTPFKLEPWQDNFIRMLFGWKIKDSQGREVRRYREVFLMIARKNGKSPLAAGIGLYTFFCDGEIGAQIFCAAADTEQAALLFRHARGMVEAEPELASRSDIFKGTGHRSIVLKKDPGSFFKVLSSDANTKHGGNTHMVMIDELHAQKDRELVDVLETSMASATRKQPLMVNITTADYERVSICNEKHDYARKVRDGIIKDHAFLPVIFECLPSDDWKDPEIWKKANPNLGISVSEDYMRAKCLKAQESPIYENTFKRLHLNIRTSSNVALIDMDNWDKCPCENYTDDQLYDEPCFGGLDLASTTDLASLALYFPRLKYVRLFFWCPGENIEVRSRRDRVPYKLWTEQGLLKQTPGNVIDYEYIINEIMMAKENFSRLQSIAFDPWNARQTAIHLQDKEGVKMIEFRQGFVTMNEPTKELLRLVKSHDLCHGGNEVLRWMATNATAQTDPAENIKISKRDSKEKVDGLIATVMALGLSMTQPLELGSALNGKPPDSII